MALQDHQTLLQALVGMQDSKRMSDRQQFDIWKNAYENRLLAKQISDAESQNNKLQSEYDKLKKASEEYAQQVDVVTNVQRILKDGWQPQDAGLLASYGLDANQIEQARNPYMMQDLIKTNPELAPILQASGLGVSGTALDTVAQNTFVPGYTQQQQGISQMQAQTAQTNAQTAQMSAQTAQLRAITEGQKTLQAEFALIDGMLASDQQKTLAKLQKVGLPLEWSMALKQFENNPEYINAFIMAQAGASQRLQEQVAGLPQEQGDPTAIDTANYRAMLERRKILTDALTRVGALPAGQTLQQDASGNLILPRMDAQMQQRFYTEYGKMIASGYSELHTQQPKAGGSVSALDQKYYESQANNTIAMVNRFNAEGLPEGESVVFGELALLAALNNTLEVNQWMGNSPDQLPILAKSFSIEMSDAIKKAGSKIQTPLSQSLTHLISNSGALNALVVKAITASKNKGGGPRYTHGIRLRCSPNPKDYAVTLKDDIR